MVRVACDVCHEIIDITTEPCELIFDQTYFHKLIGARCQNCLEVYPDPIDKNSLDKNSLENRIQDKCWKCDKKPLKNFYNVQEYDGKTLLRTFKICNRCGKNSDLTKL